MTTGLDHLLPMNTACSRVGSAVETESARLILKRSVNDSRLTL